MIKEDIKEKIINYLKTKNDGASSSDIAKAIKHNRLTVTKYLEIFSAEGILESKKIAQARIFQLKKGCRKRILIVDDEPHILNLIKLYLSNEDYDISEAQTGLEAIEKVYCERPDAIVLDLMMPGIDGFEVCERLKANESTKNIPIIILSAKEELKDKIIGIEKGADDYMTKPFEPSELLARVHNALRNTEKTHRNELIAKIRTGSGVSTTLFTLNNFDNFSKKFGYLKSNEAFTVLTKLIGQKLENYEGIGSSPIAENQILAVFRKKNGAVKEIKNEFDKMMDFITNGSQINDDEQLFLSTEQINNPDKICKRGP